MLFYIPFPDAYEKRRYRQLLSIAREMADVIRESLAADDTATTVIQKAIPDYLPDHAITEITDKLRQVLA